MNQEDELDQFPLDAKLIDPTIQLSEEQGSLIKDLIQEYYPHTFPHYCQKVGIKPPNFYNTLNGRRPCSLEFLNKLLSGIRYRAIITNPEILIQECEIGEIAHDADYIIPVDGSPYVDTEVPDIPDSFL